MKYTFKKPGFKAGIMGVGLDTYWDQFPGLRNRLLHQIKKVEESLSLSTPELSTEWVNCNLVDSTDKAFQAGSIFRAEGISILFIYLTTYAVSSTILPVVHKLGVPIVILNLTPEEAIDYDYFNQLPNREAMTGEWLAYCSACPAPEIASVFERVGIPFHEVTGTLLPSSPAWKICGEWLTAAFSAHTMRFNRLGCMGHYYSGMLDIYTDLTSHYAYFGGHIEILEVDELSALRRSVTKNEIKHKIIEIKKKFDIQDDCSDEDLEAAAKTSVALDKLTELYQLGSLAYYYKGTGIEENEQTISSIIVGNSLLTARGIMVAGEYEVKNVQAMKIMDSIGAGGSFTEYYAVDYKQDIVLMGHDGPGHPGIAEGKVKVKPLKAYHGKVGSGLSVEMRVKQGQVTLLSVVQRKNGSLFLLCAEGETVEGPILHIGNTNSRFSFPIGAKAFMENWNAQGPAHHCAVGVGHCASTLEKLGSILNMDVVKIC
jgi:L-arabinose isomerase